MLDTEIYNRLRAAVERISSKERLSEAAAAAAVNMEVPALRARLFSMARLDARVPLLIARIALDTANTLED